MRLLDRLTLWLAARRQAKFERWLKHNKVRMPEPDRTCQRFPAFKPWQKAPKVHR